MSKASRKLSLSELLKALQYEYLCCDIRIRTYVNDKHKAYWRKVAKFKKQKIENISQKQGVDSMFTNSSIEKSLRGIIYSGYGIPAFVYKDEADRLSQEKWDILNFFYRGTDVTFLLDGKEKKGVAIYTDFEERRLTVKDKNGNKHSLFFGSVSRSVW